MEYIRGPFDHAHPLRAPLGLLSALPELEMQRTLGQPVTVDVLRTAGALDVHQQIHQAARPLRPLPGRLPPPTRIHCIRLVPWLNQSLRYVDPERGKLPRPRSRAPFVTPD